MRSRFAAALLLIFAVMPLAAQYQKALPGYQYQFPRDDFNHPNYQTEWWYYTGNLVSSDGHRFGFELTFFRQGVNRSIAQPSDWDVRDIYLAHLALSDLDAGRFYHTERTNRAGPGLAGASEQLSKVWNGNWQVQWEGGQQQLQAIADNFSLRFAMTSHKPAIIHGKNGVSQKEAGTGQASHYISFTRLITKGTIQLNGKEYAVEGTSWMDHEFFTNQLDSNQSGWDWVSLQFDDDTELMLYRLRRKDGSVDPFSAGTYIDAHGKSTYLSVADFSMQPENEKGEHYTSPETRAVYPIAWRVTVPLLRLDLRITTPLKTQELVSSMGTVLSYWEGSITIRGTRDGRPATGVGYLEMTGYAGALRLLQAK
jgi:predicted secreted hydrolase